MLKKVVHSLIVFAFGGLGFYIGLLLLGSGMVGFVNNMPEQFSFGLVALGVIVGAMSGFFMAPYLMHIAVRLTVLTEQYLQRTPIQDLLMGLVGLIIGLIISNLIGSILSSIGYIGKIVWLLSTLLLCYLGLSIGIKKREELTSLVTNIIKFGKERQKTGTSGDLGGNNSKILDTSVIIDGRIADLCESGFIEGVLIVPAFVIEELRHIADASDLLKRNRGRRGLDILNRMRKRNDIKVQIYEDNRGLENITEVDSKLVKLGQQLKAKIVTNDYNLNKVAELQGVKVLNINELANAIKPVVLPGEEMTVQVIKDGKETGQGVAYLDDGTMIVIEGGKHYMNQTLPVVVTSVLQTAAGRMIFAKPKQDKKGDLDTVRYHEVNVLG
ncbi:MAG: PIN/TRAM domain-containing protein [Peptococcaceae bacterium]|nr:PIN/TRAM domain-containing protein [Peptococcaceae bacterium]